MQNTSSNKITIKLDKEITSLDFIRNYHPVVIRHALSNFPNLDLDTCLAYVSNKTVIRYLLLCDVNDVYSLKDKYKRNLTTATPSSCKLEVSKLKKALRKSKNILLSRGQKLAVGLNCRSFSDIRDLAEYGYENLKNVLPSIPDSALADLIGFQDNTDLLLECLPASRIKTIKQLSQKQMGINKDTHSTLTLIAFELKQYLLKPDLYGSDPYTFTLKTYQEKVLEFLYMMPEEVRRLGISSVRDEWVVAALKVLEPFEQFRFLSIFENETANRVFDLYKTKPSFHEVGFKYLNKIVKAICVGAKAYKLKQESVPIDLEESKIPFNFHRLNDYSSQVWEELIDDVTEKLIYCATCFCRNDVSMNNFNDFLNAKDRQINYQKFDNTIEVTEIEALDFQDKIIGECERIKAFIDDVNFSALENEIMKFHGISDESLERVPVTQEQVLYPDEECSEPETIEVYNHDDLMTNIMLGLKEHDEKIFNQIQAKGNKKRIVKVPSDFIVRLNDLATSFPNCAHIVEYLRGVMTEAFLTSKPINLPVINLDGEPGCGKSQFVLEFAKLFELESTSLPVTSMGDKFELIGAHRTWNNASIGAFAKAMLLDGETYNQCFLIDELCQVKNSGERNLVPTLLGFFETEQRKSLLENFLDVEVDFSGFIIFTTTNNIENLTPALKSRIVSFTVEKPSPEQMKIIGQNIYQKHIQERGLQEILANKIPLQCENHYLDVVPRQAKQIIESAIRKAIQRYDVNNPELISLGIHDFVSVFNNQSNHIGFIH
ncbi:AAA family ATPase [Thalassotalea profundi]|uniref:ATPase AAA-type core domain-containing protein n=1 Tax=Thalassotalea profundi TaxID=2036687 RepID=A0ABQ3IBR7_9GAMM|nr:AAA family ATPase [Thalassotalea profundi]GHE78306.1 hypothetical protein GCM10011501_02620 [Thalassotalea profundi]